MVVKSAYDEVLVKPPQWRFWDYVVDSVGEIKSANMSLLPYAI